MGEFRYAPELKRARDNEWALMEILSNVEIQNYNLFGKEISHPWLCSRPSCPLPESEKNLRESIEKAKKKRWTVELEKDGDIIVGVRCGRYKASRPEGKNYWTICRAYR